MGRMTAGTNRSEKANSRRVADAALVDRIRNGRGLHRAGLHPERARPAICSMRRAVPQDRCQHASDSREYARRPKYPYQSIPSALFDATPAGTGDTGLGSDARPRPTEGSAVPATATDRGTSGADQDPAREWRRYRCALGRFERHADSRRTGCRNRCSRPKARLPLCR